MSKPSSRDTRTSRDTHSKSLHIVQVNSIRTNNQASIDIVGEVLFVLGKINPIKLVLFARSKITLSTPLSKENMFALSSFVVPLGVLSLVLLPAQFQDTVHASSSSEGLGSAVQLAEGTLVSLITTEPISIEPADINSSDYLAGVVEAETDGLIVSDYNGSDIYIATSGVTEAFISDINGPVKTGDFIGASWIRGVGMKVLEGSESDQKILGVALQDLNTKDDSTYLLADVETPNGNKDANVGKISIKIFKRDIGPYFESNQLSGIEEFATRLAGKNVPYVRVIAALLLFVVAVIISGIFMTTAIRGSLKSIGRNPLASQSIFSMLIQISAIAIGLIIIGATVSYVVLVI